MIEAKNIVIILTIISVLVVGIVVLTEMETIFPEAMPKYTKTFPIGTAPYTYDTSLTGLTDIVVKQKFSDGSWQTIPTANYSYAGTTVTIDSEVLYV